VPTLEHEGAGRLPTTTLESDDYQNKAYRLDSYEYQNKELTDGAICMLSFYRLARNKNAAGAGEELHSILLKLAEKSGRSEKSSRWGVPPYGLVD